MTTFEFLRAFGWLLGFATNGLLLWVGWSLGKKFVTHETFSAHVAADDQQKNATRERLAEHDATLSAMADKVNAMPGKDAIHTLEVNLANIRGEQARTNEALHGMREIMRRIESQTELLYRDRLEDK